MPWPLRIVDPAAAGGEYEPGDCWFATDNWLPSELSPEYARDWAGKRAPIWVVIPYRDGSGSFPFCPDMPASDAPSGWTVTGELPNITVTPSIKAGGPERLFYHGFITNGVLTDSLDS